MVDYFIVNYARLEHGFIFLTANYFIAAGVPLALTDLGKNVSRRAVLVLILKMLCCIAAGEVVASLYHWISGGEIMMVPLVVGVVVTAVYAAAFSKLKMPVRLMRAAEYFGISQLAIGITSSIGGVLGLAYSYLQWVLICVNLIVIASGTIFIKYFSAEQGIKMHVMFPVAVVVINAMCLVFVILAALRYITSDAALVLSILFTFIDLLVYAAVTYIVRRLWSEPRKEAERLQRESERELLRMSETRLEEMRRLRHELKNQYAYMRVLLEEKEYGKLDKYFSELSDKIADTVDYTDCGNSTINAIIAAERSRVDRAGAELVCRITVPPVLGVSDIDLCSLIMNLVNNAAEYLERSPDLHDRKIEADISLSGHTLLVKISNALSDRDREHALMLETSKADKRYHGHGTRIVRSIAEKYGGAAVFAAEGGRFVAAVTLTEITSGGGVGGKQKGNDRYMRTIRVAVCDDEENVCEVISGTVRAAFAKKDIAADVEAFVTASSLLRRIEDVVFDLIFLDIDMPGTDGIQLGGKLRSRNDATDIIYVSNREDRVFDAIKVRPFGFVRKSNFISDITEAVSRYADSFRDGDDTLVVQSKRGMVNVRADEVIYFEGAGKFQNMHVVGRANPVPVYRAMETLESELAPYGFIRIHKGMLVNYRFISRILALEVELTTGTVLPLSRRKAAEIKQQYLKLLSRAGSVLL